MQNADTIPELAGSKAEEILKFTQLIKQLQNINTEFSAAGLIKHVFDYSGYKKFIDDGTVEGESRTENIYELINVASKYDNLEPGISTSIFLEEIALIADIDTLKDQDNAVTLMTVHSAKGLEFPTVFLIGLEEGILPHSRSLLEQDELEEERRLMYVAITRAKNKLYLLRARNRMLYGENHSCTPSQFLEEIPSDLIESEDLQPRQRPGSLHAENLGYTPVPYEEYDQEAIMLNNGDRVTHQTFGDGTVIGITGGVATIAFNNPQYGTKKLALSIAPLKKIED